MRLTLREKYFPYMDRLYWFLQKSVYDKDYFLPANIPARVFVEQYLSLHEGDAARYPESHSPILDRFYAQVKAFHAATEGDTPNPIAEQALRKAASLTFKALNADLASHHLLLYNQMHGWPDPDALTKRPVEISEYIAVIERFLGRHISAEDFEIEYVTLFYTDETKRTEEIFWILSGLFCEAESYWPGTLPGDENEEKKSSISEQTLRNYTSEALKKLYAAKTPL